MNRNLLNYIEKVGDFKPNIRYVAISYNEIAKTFDKGFRCQLLQVDGIDDNLQRLVIPPEFDNFYPRITTRVKDYAKLYNAVRKMEHNLDHLALCMKIKTLGYGERRISEYFPNISSNLTPDLVYQQKDSDGYYIADVTTSRDIHTAHLSKSDKYNVLIRDQIRGYATIKVLSYDFLPREYKELFDLYRKKMQDKRLWISEQSGLPMETLMEVANEIYGKKSRDLQDFTRDDLYIRNCQYFFGVDDVDELPPVDDSVDDSFAQFIKTNIKKLDDLLTYKASHEKTKETFHSFLESISVMPSDHDLKETSILRFPVGDRDKINLGMDIDVKYIKDQVRILEILSIIKGIDFDGDDESIEIIKSLAVNKERIASFVNKYDLFAFDKHTNKFIDTSEARDNFNTLLLYLHIYNRSRIINGYSDNEKSVFLRKAGFKQGTIEYNWGIMSKFYTESEKVAYEYLTSKEFLLMDKWIEVLKEYNTYNVPILYKRIEVNVTEFVRDTSSRDRKDTVNVGGKKVNRDMCFSSKDIEVVTHDFMNIGLKPSEKVSKKLKKRKSCYFYSEEDSLEFKNFLTYMSEYIGNKESLLLGTYYDDIENRSTKESVDKYISLVTSTRMYTYLRSYSELMFSYSSFSSVRLKNNMVKATIDNIGNTILLFFGGSKDSKSCISLSLHSEEIPIEYQSLLNVAASGKYNDTFVYVSKPFSVKYDLLERWADADTISLGGCAEDYYRICNPVYNVKSEDFLRDIFTFRSVLLLEGRSKTGRILEPVRYIIMNHLALYSDNPGFIKDKYNIRPMNKLHNYIYNRIYSYVSRDVDRSRLSWDKTTFNLLFSNYVGLSLQDVLSDMFTVYFTCPHTYTDFYAFSEHFKTILKFKKLRERFHEDQYKYRNINIELTDVLNNYKDYFIFSPQIAERATSFVIQRILDRVPKEQIFKDRTYSDDLLVFSSTKSIVSDPVDREDLVNDIRDFYAKLDISTLTDDGAKEAYRRLHSIRKSIAESGLRNNNKLIDKYLEYSLKHENNQLSTILTSLYDEEFFVGIRNKDEEKGKLREFGCPNFTMRQYLKVIESIGHSACKHIDEEFITKGGRKSIGIRRLVEDADINLHGKEGFYEPGSMIEDEEKMIMYTNIDHTKWSAGMTINIFA
jgi:hypothetical protein